MSRFASGCITSRSIHPKQHRLHRLLYTTRSVGIIAPVLIMTIKLPTSISSIAIYSVQIKKNWRPLFYLDQIWFSIFDFSSQLIFFPIMTHLRLHSHLIQFTFYYVNIFSNITFLSRPPLHYVITSLTVTRPERFYIAEFILYGRGNFLNCARTAPFPSTYMCMRACYPRVPVPHE